VRAVCYLVPPAKPWGRCPVRGGGGRALGFKHRHPHPRFAVLPPFRFAGGRGKSSPVCAGAGWRSQTEGGRAVCNIHRRPHPPCGVLPSDRFAGGRGKLGVVFYLLPQRSAGGGARKAEGAAALNKNGGPLDRRLYINPEADN
jgi:hypothetical protein